MLTRQSNLHSLEHHFYKEKLESYRIIYCFFTIIFPTSAQDIESEYVLEPPHDFLHLKIVNAYSPIKLLFIT